MSVCLLMILLSHAVGKGTMPFIVTQWPTVAEVMAGEDVILKCNIVELYSPCSTVVWLRLIPENATISLTDRVQIDLHHSSTKWTNICTAVITSSTVQDSGMYYCATVRGRFAHFGNGSRVIVKEHTVFPFIEILSPLIQSSHLVPLQCVVTRVESSQVHMFWVIEGRKEKAQSMWIHRHDGAIPLTRSQILLTAEEWEREVRCDCMVEFAGQRYIKTLQRHGEIHQTCVML
ncbi:uncharacterized protein LOC127425268 isoform X2 [Myxocyprinus asiaticus]|uniref:uncharacterized protein LOC127425268 isoform X2 n=1 Tax=Myxocyprinus asiaticus TaxID=70543 RepID=UPI002221DA08|nr:uncharacterized protein LOC127425268 isoform X2 [Myxocyprinus asiaticus]